MVDWVHPDAEESKFGVLEPRELDEHGRPVWYWPTLDSRLKRWGHLHPDKAKLYEAIGYRPSKSQAKVHSSLARLRQFSGGARGGKRLWAAMEVLPILLSPGTHIWIVGPRYDQAKEFEYLKQAVQMPELAFYRDRVKVLTDNPKNGDMRIVLKWEGGDQQIQDSWVQVKSTQVEDSLLGEELDAVVMSECSRVPERIWREYVLQRLTTRKGIGIFPSTPRGENWYADMVRLGEDPDEVAKKRVESYCVTSLDNPIYSDSEAAFAKRHLTPEEYDEQVLGLPTSQSGKIYPSFMSEVHVKDFKAEKWPPESSTTYLGWDFGYTNPSAVLKVSQDSDGVFYVSQEIYARRQTLEDMVRKVAEMMDWPVTTAENGMLEAVEEDDSCEMVFCDWEPRTIREINEYGITARRVKSKDVHDGIRSVRRAMALRENGKPGLYVDKGCRNLVKELIRYRFAEDRSRTERGLPEAPVKKDDHAVDALRYILHSVERLAGIGSI